MMVALGRRSAALSERRVPARFGGRAPRPAERERKGEAGACPVETREFLEESGRRRPCAPMPAHAARKRFRQA
jgi:3-mercaptopyruvate sulfurtransferase SseA